MKLNLGCGKEFAPGPEWVNVDLYVTLPEVLKYDICKLPLEWTDHFDEVYCQAVLEHISWRKGITALKEMFRVLKSGGKLTVTVPDLDWTCEMFASLKGGTPAKDYMLMVLYGHQEHEGEYHKCGFTPATLKGCLESVGFLAVQIDDVWTYGSKCILAQCTKGGVA